MIAFAICSIVKFVTASAAGALVLVVKAVVSIGPYGKALIIFVGLERKGRSWREGEKKRGEVGFIAVGCL